MSNPVPGDSSRDLTGRELGDYCLLRRLGSGGMAEVYLAEQKSLSRQVALKVLHPRLSGDASYVERFQQEARAAASLVHPSIVQIYEVGQLEGVHFIAQEYVQGKNLGQVMQREGALPPGLVLEIMRQVVAALCKAEEFSIVHRDLKPENILLNQSGEVKVADFGLARVLDENSKTLTQVGVTMGTPLYMSPEQIEGRPIDARSDIYSLGVTCYHLLTGEPPHRGETALAIAVQHLNSAPRPLENVRSDISSALARIVHGMMSKKPEQRPESPSELLAQLRELAGSAEVEGWGEGSRGWSLVEKLASGVAATESTDDLGRLMQEERRIRLPRLNIRRLTIGLVVAALAGVVLGVVTRPRSYINVGGARASAVPTRSSAEAQLYHAKMNASEAAWQAVWEKFPDADPFLHQLAWQGLVRHLLAVTEEYKKADQILRPSGPLGELAASQDSSDSLRAFIIAGRCIALEGNGRTRESREAYARLTPDMKDYLSRVEKQLYQMLQSSLERVSE